MKTLVTLYLVLFTVIGFFAGYLFEYQNNLRAINQAQIDLQRTGEERDKAEQDLNVCQSTLEAESVSRADLTLLDPLGNVQPKPEGEQQ